MAENIQSFLGRFNKVKQTGNGQYICQCPAHTDKKSSLSIKDDTNGSGRILLTCHAGCDTADILAEVGLSFKDIQPGEPKAEEKKKLEKWQINLTAEYRYRNAKGEYLYSKLRYEGPDIDGKQIRYGRIVDGKYSPGKGDIDADLYNVESLSDAIAEGKTVYYVEGEKDVETLRELGLVAVTAGGTNDWKSRYAEYFIGVHDLVVIQDNDSPGEALAKKVTRDLRSVVYKQRIIIPSKFEHGDVTDWIENEGGDREKLFAMALNAEQVMASWVGEKNKINESLLADAILEHSHVIIARDPGTKSDRVLWYSDGVYHTQSENEVQARVDHYLPKYVSKPYTLAQTSKMITVRGRAVAYDAIDADERYINVRNGLIKMPECVLVPHTPALLSTVQLACDYDPNATAPMWQKFKEEFCKDEEGSIDQDMLRLDRMKWGLIVSTIHGFRLKGAFVQFSSEGNTGKSVDCELLTHILGVDNTANVSFQDMSNDRWATGRCWGKRLVVVGDQGRESIKDSNVFKMLTGGDTVSAEFKGLAHFNYRFRGVILVSCNHLPVFEDDKGEHMSERLNFLHCRNVIPPEARDPYLRDKLQQEASGILNWALEGLKDYINNGNRLCSCDSSEELMTEYRCRYDTFFAFLNEYCVVTKDMKQYIKKSDLEDEYVRFCTQNDFTALDKRNIKNRAASQGIPLKVLQGYPVYRGIQWKGYSNSVAGYEEMDEAIPF